MQFLKNFERLADQLGSVLMLLTTAVIGGGTVLIGA